MTFLKNKTYFKRFFTIFFTSFSLGVIFSLIVTDFHFGGLGKSEKGSQQNNWAKESHGLNVEKLFQAYYILQDHYYSQKSIKNDELVEHAIKGMIEGLGDRHSEYMTYDEAERFNEVLNGDFEGIGAVVEKNPLGVEIERILKGSPAKKYGLLKGDILLEANSEPLGGLDLYEAVEKIKGPAGTKVILKILRTGENDYINREVIRGKITIPSVDSRYLDEDKNFGYIALNMFGDHTETEFLEALGTMKNTKGLILDLRDNGGGYLQSAVSILSYFIESGENLVYTKYRNVFDNTVYKSVNFGDIYKGKIVVLINENSASASEITAGALRDYNKAILVGKKSYGKGSVQQPFDMGGGLLKLTIAQWFTPSDKNIDEEGITPDIDVGFEKEDYENEYDRQLEIGKEVLHMFLKYGAPQFTIDSYLKKED